MTLPSPTEKAIDEGLSSLDRLGHITATMTLLGFLFAVDIATTAAFGKNVLAFDWRADTQWPWFGWALLFLTAYSLHLTVVTPLILMLLRRPLDSIRRRVNRMPAERSTSAPVGDHLPVAEVRANAYLHQDSAMMDRADRALDDHRAEVVAHWRFEKSSFACVVLALVDLGLSDQTFLRFLIACCSDLSGMDARLALLALIGLGGAVVTPWLLASFGALPRYPEVYDPRLADQINRKRQPLYQRRPHPIRQDPEDSPDSLA